MRQLLRQSGLDSAQSLDESSDSGLYEKEVAFADDFVKIGQDGTEVEFSLTPEVLDLLSEETNRMIGNGVRVPSPLDHRRDAEANRGEWVAFRRGLDSKNREALFGHFRPRDQDAAKLVKSSDVSVHLLPGYKDGRKNEYKYVVRHVALTDYPVLSSMDQFKALAASEEADVLATVTRNPERNDKMLDQIIKRLDLSLSESDSSDEKKQTELILAQIDELLKTRQESSEQLEELKTKLEASESEVTRLRAASKPPKEIDSLLLSVFKDSRETKIDSLVKDGRLTPASADSLKKVWCSRETMTRGLELSEDGRDPLFEALLSTLGEQPQFLLDEETRSQQPYLELSQTDLRSTEKNPLLADMESRSKSSAKASA